METWLWGRVSEWRVFRTVAAKGGQSPESWPIWDAWRAVSAVLTILPFHPSAIGNGVIF
jgi:hypothetical protein